MCFYAHLTIHKFEVISTNNHVYEFHIEVVATYLPAASCTVIIIMCILAPCTIAAAGPGHTPAPISYTAIMQSVL